MLEVKVETDENGDGFIPISTFKDIIDIDCLKPDRTTPHMITRLGIDDALIQRWG